MTIKKYLEDQYKSSFDAIILEKTTFNDLPAIILNETYFYPEGGGQPADHGKIGPFDIMDVQIDHGVIYHILSFENVEKHQDEINTLQSFERLELNTSLLCTIDFERRFNLMQQHAGQHLLSSTAYNLFKTNTIGFHIGLDYITIDLDQSFTQEQVDLIELEANRIIHLNREIKSSYPDELTLKSLPLRKVPKVTSNIRVVEIESQDYSPCGGTHPRSTGEIGLIKIKKFEKYKSGIRVTFICGLEALKYAQIVQNQTMILSRMLARPELEITQGVQALLDKSKEDRKAIDVLETAIAENEVESLKSELEVENAPHFIVLSKDLQSPNQFKKLVELWLKEDDVILLASNKAEYDVQFYLGISKNLKDVLSIKDIFEIAKAKYSLRGGGSPFMIQFKVSEVNMADTIFTELEESMNLILLDL